MPETWVNVSDGGCVALETQTRLLPSDAAGGPWRVLFLPSGCHSVDTYASEAAAKAAIDDLVSPRSLSDLD